MARLTLRLLLAAGVLTLLAGCAGPAGPPSPVESPSTGPAEAPADAEAEADVPPSRVSRPEPELSLALRSDSRAALETGDPGRAMALLERAIRIEPRRPELWLDLAELHLDQGRPTQARQMARRGAVLARGRPELERRAAQLLERIARVARSG